MRERSTRRGGIRMARYAAGVTHRSVPARFIWNWNSLVGCVQGALQAFGHPHDAAWVSGALGEAFRGVPALLLEGEPAFARTGYQPRPLQGLRGSLEALGLRVEIETRDLTRQGPPRFLGRRIRGRIAGGSPVIAHEAGMADFALLVGYDDGRRCYRLDGPLTAQVGELAAVRPFPRRRCSSADNHLPENGHARPRGGCATGRGTGAVGGIPSGAGPVDHSPGERSTPSCGGARLLGHRSGRGPRRSRPLLARAVALESRAGLRNLETVADGYRAVALALSRAATLSPSPPGATSRAAGDGIWVRVRWRPRCTPNRRPLLDWPGP